MATTTTSKPGSAQDTARTSIGLIGTGQQGTTSTQARQEALIRQLKAEYGIQVTEKMAEAIGKVFDNMIGKENDAADLILKMAQGQITRRQDLQMKQAELAMNIMAGPEQTKAHIAGLAVGFATICRLFGADDLANTVESKAKEILSTVTVRMDPDKIENGLQKTLDAKVAALSSLNGMGAARGAAAGAQGVIRDADGLTPSIHDIYQSPAQSVTWDALYKGAKDAGLDEKGLAALKRSFDASKNIATKNEVVDNGSERLQMFYQASREMTARDKATLAKVLDTTMGPIEISATKGPR